LALLLRWPSLKIQGQYLCSRSALVDEFHKCSFSLLFCYIRTLLSTSFDSTARVTSTAPPKSSGMSDADLQFSTCCVLPFFWSILRKTACFLTGMSLWTMVLAIILAILVYYYMQHKEDLLAMLPQ
jgi:uncharacterized membrane protein YdjX (TVP38/TMEM64 family)